MLEPSVGDLRSPQVQSLELGEAGQVLETGIGALGTADVESLQQPEPRYVG